MYQVPVYIRKTFSYVDGWSSLDREEYLATLKFTPPSVIALPSINSDHSEGPTYVQHARAPSGVDVSLLKQAIRDTTGGSNCRHEYDCCGCASRFVRVTNRGRKLRIVTQISFNY